MTIGLLGRFFKDLRTIKFLFHVLVIEKKFLLVQKN